MKLKKLTLRIFSPLFEYETVKYVSIHSKKVGLMCRFVQLVIIGYVIGYVIIYKKGYQDTDVGISGLLSKVKGVSLTNRTGDGGQRIWDVADYVVPPQEENAFFITTNALLTFRQRQDKCPEDESIEEARCRNDSECLPSTPILLGDGVRTGKCSSNGTCEIYAWCPVESSKDDAEVVKTPLLKNVNNFTVYIKNNVEFKKFNISRSNIPSNYNSRKLRSCRYNKITDSRCPVFTIDSILKLTATQYDDIARIGGVISILINWDCNLDVNIENCFPTYSFDRLDSSKTDISKGWNFRYANYYYMNEIQYRDLIKAYGIRFLVTVTSKAGKFSIIPLTMNLGSGIALLSIASIVCDFIVLYILTNRQKYNRAKFRRLEGEDPFKPFDSDSESNK